MDERQRLQTDLKRYRGIRDLVNDEQLIATIGELIRETEERLARIEGRVELGGPVPKAEEAGAAKSAVQIVRDRATALWHTVRM